MEAANDVGDVDGIADDQRNEIPFPSRAELI